MVETRDRYLSGSAEGSIPLSIPRNQVSASPKLLHPAADKQKCGLENNNKKLVDRIKMVTAAVLVILILLSFLS